APDARTVRAPPTARAPATTADARRHLLAPIARVLLLGDGAVRFDAVIRELLGAHVGLGVLQAEPLLAAVARCIAREAPDRGVATKATMEVRGSNRAALALYDRLGFRVAARRPKYYTRPEEDALILWRDSLDTSS